MLVEVVVVGFVVLFLLRRSPKDGTPPPNPEIVHIQPPDTNRLTLNVTNLNSTGDKKQHSPTPSVGSSSGCESAFSCVNSGEPSRDPSPVNANKASNNNNNKKQKKKNKSHHHELIGKRSLSIGSTGVRLKSDNWEWHSRAKVLAAQFIKENYDASGTLRGSF